MVYRMNRRSRRRKLGMAVFWCPTDTANTFIDWPQRQRAMAVPYLEVPNVRSITCRWRHARLVPLRAGRRLSAQLRRGRDGRASEDRRFRLYRLRHAGVVLAVQGPRRQRLIYFGGATNICLTGKDVGLGPMYTAGFDCYFRGTLLSP